LVVVEEQQEEEREASIKKFLMEMHSDGGLKRLVEQACDIEQNSFLSFGKLDISDLDRLQEMDETLYREYLEAINDDDFDAVSTAFLCRRYKECSIEDPSRIAKSQYLISKLYKAFKE
jgi:hypothetical protein